MSPPERSVAELRAWLAAAPAGTLVPAAIVSQALADDRVQTSAKPAAAPSWRERLWTVPPETRIGVVEMCEAVGRTKSWVYRCTGPKAAGPRLPHRLLHGELVFVVGELRQWLLEQEEIVVPGRTTGLVVHQTKRRA